MMHVDEPCPDRTISLLKVQVTHNTGEAIVVDAGLTGEAITLVCVDQDLANGTLPILAISYLLRALDRRLKLALGRPRSSIGSQRVKCQRSLPRRL